jgi:Cu-Zn family superoxide dismutase
MYSHTSHYMQPIKAVCVIVSKQIEGVVYLEQQYDITTISGTIKGLKPNSLHAIHIHEYGDLTEGCNSCCSHYNPHNMNHGAPYSADRHVGDLGNIKTDINGIAKFEIVDTLVRLDGNHNVIGRSIVIHEDPDDMGMGNHIDSMTTGHAGKRIGCGVIGLARVKC